MLPGRARRVQKSTVSRRFWAQNMAEGRSVRFWRSASHACTVSVCTAQSESYRRYGVKV